MTNVGKGEKSHTEVSIGDDSSPLGCPIYGSIASSTTIKDYLGQFLNDGGQLLKL